MMDIKKFFRNITVICFAFLFSFSIFACSDKTNNDTLWFQVLKETSVEIGTLYSIPDAVARKGDSYYNAHVKVSNNDGNVEIDDNSFFVDTSTDYTITYSVKINGKTISKTTLVKVTDTTKPVINFATMPRVAQGASVTPLYTVTDNSGYCEYDLKVYYKEETESIALTDGNTFTADKAGYYTVKVTANDASGNTSEATAIVLSGYDLIMPEEDVEAEPGIMLSNNASIVKGIAGVTNGVREGSYTYKIVNSSYWYPRIIFDLDFRENVASVYDYMTYWIYNDGNKNHLVATGTTWSSGTIMLPAKEWTKVTVPRNSLLATVTAPDWYIDNSTNFGDNHEDAFSVYIDEIRGGFDVISGITDEEINLSAKLNDIADVLDADIVEFIVKDSSNNTVTNGVNASAYTVTPAAGDNYTVLVTLRKNDYNEVTLEIPISVWKASFVTPSFNLDVEVSGAFGVPADAVSYNSGSAVQMSSGSESLREGEKMLEFAVWNGIGYPRLQIKESFRTSVASIYDKLTFWVYNNGNKDHHIATGSTWSAAIVLLPSKQWTKVSIPKASLLANTDGRWYINNTNDLGDNYEAGFTIYIDEVRGEFDGISSDVGVLVDLYAKLSGIANSLGAGYADFWVEDSDGNVVQTGIDAEALTFTPSATGVYTICAELTKKGYENIVLEIILDVPTLAEKGYNNWIYKVGTTAALPYDEGGVLEYGAGGNADTLVTGGNFTPDIIGEYKYTIAGETLTLYAMSVTDYANAVAPLNSMQFNGCFDYTNAKWLYDAEKEAYNYNGTVSGYAELVRVGLTGETNEKYKAGVAAGDKCLYIDIEFISVSSSSCNISFFYHASNVNYVWAFSNGTGGIEVYDNDAGEWLSSNDVINRVFITGTSYTVKLDLSVYGGSGSVPDPANQKLQIGCAGGQFYVSNIRFE